MPLDGHSYLVSQGWSGKGTGLRQGAITRPIVVTQKKTLSGLGKDRDEAFPFWDHLFSAASKAIKVKIDSSDSSDSDDDTTNPAPVLKRTTTGILSNRRPVDVTPASMSGSATPDPNVSNTPRLSLIALAKREAARRHLYSKFYRGLIIAPEAEFPNKPVTSVDVVEPTHAEIVAPVERSRLEGEGEAAVEKTGKSKEKGAKKRKSEELEKDAERREKKRRKKGSEEALDKETNEERREKKRRKKELKAEEISYKKKKKEKRNAMKTSTFSEKGSGVSDDEAEREERRRRRREEKEKKRQCKEASLKDVDVVATDEAPVGRRKRNSEGSRTTVEEHALPKVKKKRKAEAIS